MAGNALLWKGGHYSFGEADKGALPNIAGLGSEILESAQQKVDQRNLNQKKARAKDGIFVGEEIELGKKKRGRPSYDVDNFLMGANGLDLISKHCKEWKFKHCKGSERSDLKRLIKKYEEWCFIMYPSMRFEDLVNKTLTFSSKHKVKQHLQTLRDKRDGVNVIGEDDEDIDILMDGDEQMGDNRNINQAQTKLQRLPDEAPNQNSNNNNNNNNNYAKQSGFDTVVEARANRTNNAVNNATNNNNANNDFMDFGGDPMDFMDFGEDPDDNQRDIERAMYG